VASGAGSRLPTRPLAAPPSPPQMLFPVPGKWIRKRTNQRRRHTPPGANPGHGGRGPQSKSTAFGCRKSFSWYTETLQAVYIDSTSGILCTANHDWTGRASRASGSPPPRAAGVGWGGRLRPPSLGQDLQHGGWCCDARDGSAQDQKRPSPSPLSRRDAHPETPPSPSPLDTARTQHAGGNPTAPYDLDCGLHSGGRGALAGAGGQANSGRRSARKGGICATQAVCRHYRIQALCPQKAHTGLGRGAVGAPVCSASVGLQQRRWGLSQDSTQNSSLTLFSLASSTLLSQPSSTLLSQPSPTLLSTTVNSAPPQASAGAGVALRRCSGASPSAAAEKRGACGDQGMGSPRSRPESTFGVYRRTLMTLGLGAGGAGQPMPHPAKEGVRPPLRWEGAQTQGLLNLH